jgi:3-oxoadipate enol-lactonase
VIVDANGVALNVVIEGPEGAPWITFVGGIANDHRLWDGAAWRLRDDYRLLRFDSRGHGASGSTPAPYTLPLLAGDVIALWDALGIERSCLAGLGLGGVVAVEAALRQPAGVTALVPVSCRASVTDAYRAIWPPMVELASSGGMQAVAQTTIERWFAADFRDRNPELIATIRDAILATSVDGYLGSIAALLSLDWRQRLDAFRMPVLYVSGEHDRVGAPPEVMQELSDATPGSRHVVLPGATHLSVVCNPDAFARALRSLLAAR